MLASERKTTKETPEKVPLFLVYKKGELIVSEILPDCNKFLLYGFLLSYLGQLKSKIDTELEGDDENEN